MTAIFISYASRDQHDADRIVRALEARGLKCWMSSRDIPFGQDYQAHIVEAIEAARVMLVLLSRHSAASREVPKETALASEINRVMIPVRIDASELTGALRYQATNAQRLDLSSNFDVRIDELARQLARVLDMEESTERQLRRLAERRRIAHVVVWPVALAVIAALAIAAWNFAPRPEWLRERLAQAAMVRAWRASQQGLPATAPQALAPAPQALPPARPATPDFRARAADFVQRYYAAMSGPDEDLAGAIQQMVADPIQYQGRPIARRVLMAQETAWGQRWPDRRFTARPDSLQVSCNMSAICAITGVVDYDLHSAVRGMASTGSDRFTMRVSFAGPARLMNISREPLPRQP
jgi:hypothetical protein